MKKSFVYCSLFFALIFNSCTSTKIASSWRDPETHVHMSELKKVLVVSLLKNETSRRKAEDEMVKYLDGKGVVSYNYLDENFNKKDETQLRKKIKEDGFDGAITMRLIDVDKEKVFVPTRNISFVYPDYYHNFHTYYHRGLINYSNPGYFVVTKKFIVETVIYSIEDNKIIWSGITETFDPNGVTKMTNEISKVVYKKMQKEGFVQQ